jgi:hypothetical protein
MKDKNTLLFTMRNGTRYENKLTGLLFGFSGDPLVFEQRPSTGQYCRMDRVGLLVRPFMGNPFTASLGYFVEVDGLWGYAGGLRSLISHNDENANRHCRAGGLLYLDLCPVREDVKKGETKSIPE